MRTRRSSRKSLTDQAAELVDQVGPHVEAARERFVNDILPAAQSMLADARDAAQDAAASAEKSTRKSRKRAAKRAREMVDSAVAAAPEGLPLVDKAKAKPRRKKRFLLLLALVGAGALVFKRLRGGAPASTAYVPPRPAPTPTPVTDEPRSSTPPAPPEQHFEPEVPAGAETTDQGGAFLDEVLADADEAPHEATTPDQPAEVEDVSGAKHSSKA
jgi:hypothetical protein